MEFKFLVLTTIIVACKAFEKDSQKEKQEFIRLAGLGNLRAYLGNDLYYTINRYNEIKSVYETAIDDFKRDVSNGKKMMIEHYRDLTDGYYSRTCFEQLEKVAHALFLFKTHLVYKLTTSSTSDAMELAKGIKKEIGKHYDVYLDHKNFFYPKPYANSSFFYTHDDKCRKDFIGKIKKPVEKFIKMGEAKRELTKT